MKFYSSPFLSVATLLIWFAIGNQTVLAEEVLLAGCTNPAACNYNASATTDDGSCLISGNACDDGNPNTGPGTVQSHNIGSITFGAWNTINPVASGGRMGQTFVANASGAITSARLAAAYVTWATGTMTCAIYDAPGGTLLANATGSVTVQEGQNYTFNFTGVEVQAGESYFVEWTITYAGHVLYHYWGTSYDDGEAYFDGVATGNDLAFRITFDCACAGGEPVTAGCTDEDACNYDASATSDDGSCTFPDACGSCEGGNTPGCNDANACNYNESATCDDGSCFYTCNDVPSGAVQLTVSQLGVCNALTGQDLHTAESDFGGFIAAGSNDLWYLIEATTSGIRIELHTLAFDAIVELLDDELNNLKAVNLNEADGNEVLNFGGLTPGESYYIRIAATAATAGASLFDICAQQLPETFVTTAEGTYSACQNLKARWVSGSNNYTFRATPQGGGDPIVYSTNAAFTVAPIQNIGLNWNTTYDLTVDVQLALSTADGGTENIAVQGTTERTFTIDTPPTATLRPADDLANAGPLMPGAYVFATPWICTTIGWTWRFENTEGGQLPITYYRDAPGRQLRLLWVPGLQPGVTYNVSVKPEFASGIETQYGDAGQIQIVGNLNVAPGDFEEPIENEAIANRWLQEQNPAVKLYPNPNRGDFINLNIDQLPEGVNEVLFELSDARGQRVQREIFRTGDASSLQNRIVFRNLRPGMYIATLIMGEKTHTERIIIQR